MSSRSNSLIRCFFFPGVIMHQLAQQLICRLYRIPVFKVVYFQSRNPAGYVLHETPDNKQQCVWISTGPFLLNTILGFIIALPAALPVMIYHAAKPLDYLFVYLGLSMAMNAFPSTGEHLSNLQKIKEKDTSLILRLLCYPPAFLMCFNSRFRFVQLPLLYGIIIAIGLPHMLVYLLS